MRFQMILPLFSLCFLVLVLINLEFSSAAVHYEQNWNSLDSRPLPDWYDKAKVGIFIHWGVFSVQAYTNEWFWWHWQHDKNKQEVEFMAKNYPPDFKYQDFAPMFHARDFNPNQWAELFKKAGAKYVVLTAKHHDGYTLWPSKHSPHWNAMEVGPKRDLVGELEKAVRSHNLTWGLYHSLLEWYHPLCLADKKNNWKTHEFPLTKVRPEFEELVTKYRPSVIFSDGTWEAPDSYWNSTGMLSWLYNDSPVKSEIVVNDRWGDNTECKHGGYWNCHDRFVPTSLQPHKWENAMSLDHVSWGYRKTAQANDYVNIDELLRTLIPTIAFGGNILINVGPTAEGVIVHYMSDVLLQLGEWLHVNGEAIYESKPWRHQHDSLNKALYYTERAGHVYGLTNYTKAGENVEFGDIQFTAVKSVSLLGHTQHLDFHKSGQNNHVAINIPNDPNLKYALVFRFELH